MWIQPYPPEATVLRSGCQWTEPVTGYTRDQLIEYGKRCAQSARGAEREACARVCDSLPTTDPDGPWLNHDMSLGAYECAAAIRARGQEAG